ncbi:MAG: 2-oxo acid dehydrogenase subunit E2 [Proteobacteria bacterium]|nr:2-oxo acid dehydrogenase subunit E2 [Pseudomonadota bacterium]
MIELPLPSLGPDMTSGKLLEWRIAPGQKIRKGDVIAVVDTEKAAIDVESWHDGEVIELLAEPGAEIAVGMPIVRLADHGETPVAARPAATSATPPEPARRAPPVEAPASKAANLGETGGATTFARASPAARRRAQALDIDLAQLRGSGPGGAIQLQDVERAAAPKSGAAKAVTSDRADRHEGMRRSIALAMARSKREIPHYYLWDEIDVTTAMQWLQSSNEKRPVTSRLLPAALLLAAVARAAAEFPDMNGSWEHDAFQPSSAVHLGVAIALRGGGLIAPALRDAHKLGLDELMRNLSDLVRRARAGGLRSSEISGQTLTVTNLGDEGSAGLLGVIYPPQVALVGIGRIGPRPAVEAGALVARERVTISLAADHRVSDGRRGAQFLARIASRLQQPESL